MTALLSGPDWWAATLFGAAIGAGGTLMLLGFAVRDVYGVSLRRLWRDWQNAGERR